MQQYIRKGRRKNSCTSPRWYYPDRVIRDRNALPRSHLSRFGTPSATNRMQLIVRLHHTGWELGCKGNIAGVPAVSGMAVVTSDS